MSFNIRYGTADDGDDSWPKRHELVSDVIRKAAPDVLGVQEALRFQLDELHSACPGYQEIGVGRDDGKTKGEYSSILFKKDRLRVLEHGDFWLSDEPEVVASSSWGNSIPRLCTWARFEALAGGSQFLVFNTHWDHRSQPSRVGAAQLILDRMHGQTSELPDELPVVLMGDFNAGEDNPAFLQLLRDERTPLVDSFRVLHPDQEGVGTFNGFKGKTDGAKIDAVLVSKQWEVLSAEINRTQRDGRFPSDHFPVAARIRTR